MIATSLSRLLQDIEHAYDNNLGFCFSNDQTLFVSKDSDKDHSDDISPVVTKCLDDLVAKHQNQGVICLGAHNSGKTICTKSIVTALLKNFSQFSESSWRPLLLTSFRLNSLFGCCSLPVNIFSTRVGCYYKFLISKDSHELFGFERRHFLFERSRITWQSPGESNFIVLQHFIDIIPKTHLAPWVLIDSKTKRKKAFRLLSNPCDPLPQNIRFTWLEILDLFNSIGISEDSTLKIFEGLCCVLHLGEVELTVDDSTSGYSIVSNESYEFLCSTLGVESFDQLILRRVANIEDQSARTSLATLENNFIQAKVVIDVLIKELYERIFEYVQISISKAWNNAIHSNHGVENSQTVKLKAFSILDFLGASVESSDQLHNFENFCSHYAYEKLHDFRYENSLRKIIYEWESDIPYFVEEYRENQKIPLSFDYFTEHALVTNRGGSISIDEKKTNILEHYDIQVLLDNSYCVDMVENAEYGLMNILDEFCSINREKYFKSTENLFATNLLQKFDVLSDFAKRVPMQATFWAESSPYLSSKDKDVISFRKAISANSMTSIFGVRHYWGNEFYSVVDFPEKSLDRVNNGVEKLLRNSKNSFIRCLFDGTFSFAHSTETVLSANNSNDMSDVDDTPSKMPSLASVASTSLASSKSKGVLSRRLALKMKNQVAQPSTPVDMSRSTISFDSFDDFQNSLLEEPMSLGTGVSSSNSKKRFTYTTLTRLKKNCHDLFEELSRFKLSYIHCLSDIQAPRLRNCSQILLELKLNGALDVLFLNHVGYPLKFSWSELITCLIENRLFFPKPIRDIVKTMAIEGPTKVNGRENAMSAKDIENLLIRYLPSNSYRIGYEYIWMKKDSISTYRTNLEVSMATRLQALWRQHVQCRSYKLTKRSISTIQRLWSMLLQRHRYIRFRSVIRKLQSFWRRNKVRKFYFYLKNLQKYSWIWHRWKIRMKLNRRKGVLLLHRWLKSQQLSYKVQRRLHSWIKLRSWLRGTLCRLRYLNYIRSVVRIQSNFRRRQVAKAYQNIWLPFQLQRRLRKQQRAMIQAQKRLRMRLWRLWRRRIWATAYQNDWKALVTMGETWFPVKEYLELSSSIGKRNSRMSSWFLCSTWLPSPWLEFHQRACRKMKIGCEISNQCSLDSLVANLSNSCTTVTLSTKYRDSESIHKCSILLWMSLLREMRDPTRRFMTLLHLAAEQSNVGYFQFIYQWWQQIEVLGLEATENSPVYFLKHSCFGYNRINTSYSTFLPYCLDADGRNCLHYSFFSLNNHVQNMERESQMDPSTSNAAFNTALDISNLILSLDILLLAQPDRFGKTPLDYLFHALLVTTTPTSSLVSHGSSTSPLATSNKALSLSLNNWRSIRSKLFNEMKKIQTQKWDKHHMNMISKFFSANLTTSDASDARKNDNMMEIDQDSNKDGEDSCSISEVSHSSQRSGKSDLKTSFDSPVDPFHKFDSIGFTSSSDSLKGMESKKSKKKTGASSMEWISQYWRSPFYRDPVTGMWTPSCDYLGRTTATPLSMSSSDTATNPSIQFTATTSSTTTTLPGNDAIVHELPSTGLESPFMTEEDTFRASTSNVEKMSGQDLKGGIEDQVDKSSLKIASLESDRTKETPTQILSNILCKIPLEMLECTEDTDVLQRLSLLDLDDPSLFLAYSDRDSKILRRAIRKSRVKVTRSLHYDHLKKIDIQMVSMFSG